MQTIILPNNIHIDKGNQIFDGVFEQSLDFRIEMDFDAAMQFIRRIGGYNAFEPETVIDTLECADRMLPHDRFGHRQYDISVGREGSPVIYLFLREFAEPRIQEMTLKCVRDEMELRGLADEASYEIEEFPNAYRKVTFRFWWD
jgi:hypothetical protein